MARNYPSCDDLVLLLSRKVFGFYYRVYDCGTKERTDEVKFDTFTIFDSTASWKHGHQSFGVHTFNLDKSGVDLLNFEDDVFDYIISTYTTLPLMTAYGFNYNQDKDRWGVFIDLIEDTREGNGNYFKVKDLVALNKSNVGVEFNINDPVPLDWYLHNPVSYKPYSRKKVRDLNFNVCKLDKDSPTYEADKKECNGDYFICLGVGVN